MSPMRPNPVRFATMLAAAIGTLAGLGLVSPAARAGEIHPELLREFSMLSPGDPATAIVVLARQADLPALDAELRSEHATRQERHAKVVDALRSEARASQLPVLADLDRLSALGEVESYRDYWIANVVVVRATRSAVEELARRSDVASIDPAFGIVLDRIGRPAAPSVSDPASAAWKDQFPPASRGIGVAGGVRAINAPRVWRELHVNGSGALIGILDTGADGNHPALHDGWRGNNGHPWQECWHDVVGSSHYPIDDASGHGTHATGTTSGIAVTTGDTIGVAWGAQWIAANVISEGLGSDFETDLVDCFQWLVDPDGNPGTIDDVPDVILCAWGVNEAHGFPDCDSSWWPLIDACEAAGTVVVWSAGGDGPGAGTIRSPADRATTAYNAFSVGAVDADHYEFPYPIASFSSRGPSGCDVPAPLKIKPEVVAPGIDIYSSVPGGEYQVWSGTAMASAHVAGVAALLRSADPDIEVDQVKDILMRTARDGGTPGEDNTYGWGTIDAYAAVAQLVPPASVDGAGGRSGIGISLAVSPNPFGHETSIRFRILKPGPAALGIYDAGGRLVRVILTGSFPAGEHDSKWDGRDASGALVPAGVYFVRLSSAGRCGRAAMLMVR